MAYILGSAPRHLDPGTLASYVYNELNTAGYNNRYGVERALYACHDNEDSMNPETSELAGNLSNLIMSGDIEGAKRLASAWRRMGESIS